MCEKTPEKKRKEKRVPKPKETRITMLRKERGISQTALADMLGCQGRTLRGYEGAKPTPIPSDILVALSKYFEVSTDYILGVSDYRNIGNKDIKDAIGISDQNIEALRFYKKYHNNAYRERALGGINIILEDLAKEADILRRNESPEELPDTIAGLIYSYLSQQVIVKQPAELVTPAYTMYLNDPSKFAYLYLKQLEEKLDDIKRAVLNGEYSIPNLAEFGSEYSNLNIQAFDTPAEFEEARKRIIEGKEK